MKKHFTDPIIVTKWTEGICIHTFISSFEGNNIANATHIIENNELVIIDAQFLQYYAQKFKEYAKSLNKKINRLYISHRHPDHWFGLNRAFRDIPIYALNETKDFIEKNGKESIDDHKFMGDQAPKKALVPQNVVIPNKDKTVIIDEVEYLFEKIPNTEIDFLLSIKLPKLKVHIVQDLIYSGTHLYLTRHFQEWIKVLQQMLMSKYEWFLPGHGLPADKREVAENLIYLIAAKEAFDNGLKDEDFENFLIKRFPERDCQGIFKIYVPRLFDGAKDF